MKSAHTTARAGFTLIELLMVILIIGLLSGLLLVAVNAGLKKAQEAAVATEIEQLSMAVETFKNDKGTYPISFGWTIRETPSDTSYGQRMMRTVSKVFPRYAGGYKEFYDDVIAGTQHITVMVNGSPSQGLNVEKLDSAESLVFWLGGLPDPNSETKLLGFRSDPSQPFACAAVDFTNGKYLQNRQQPRFPFDPTRLVDYDGDGWWEYLPKQKPTLATEMAPYIYFDSAGYDKFPYYPMPAVVTGTAQVDPAISSNWGNAVPYANMNSVKGLSSMSDLTSLPAAWKPQWMNSKKFQLIAPGRDGCYGRALPVSGPDNVFIANPVPQIWHELRLLPNCSRVTDMSAVDYLLPDTELDNQTNFTTGKLGDERE